MRLQINQLVPLAAVVLLSGCIPGGNAPSRVAAPVTNGPAADYPVVIGEPFTIAGETYTPSDQLNYDAVGYALVLQDEGAGVTASHKVLPLPSYAEVTSLESGRTILVRVESRGPMVNDRLVGLSRAAAAQLGVTGTNSAPVRVRRVNPPEPERAMLRTGKPAPERMETPQPLLKVLTRKLAENSPLSAGKPAPPPAENPPAAVPAPAPATQLPPPAPPRKNDLVVQVAAFSSKNRAEAAAAKMGANVSKPGQYWYVRLGPYTTQADASAGLAEARAAGYGDARIQRIN